MAGKRAVTRSSLPEVIADDLRERILSGELAEGETIRQEALAEEYAVSRMPIREALKRLDAEGLVQFTNNRGASVTKHSLREIAEIFDLRILLEVDLFRRAIPAMTAQDFTRCTQILKDMDASYDANDVAKWGALNHKYHSALYAAADRKLTNEVLQGISLHCDRFIRMHLSVMKQREPAKKEHHDLLDLAQARDVEGACAALTHHISRTKEELLSLVAEHRATADS
ncbi:MULTISPECIES: GntR family transcriptional regulator [unclassified Leisingera]|uniref:GntR family transcriptional regulator n=1 Tax=unclassified Leisingera TaxID=2614906 RepID=UPI0002DD7952|nr:MULTISPECIES: GntR family transcriptional regulator [unclassified Leisingera]KIC52558.1 GntR family transcriptional regulator [Leisingera sp. ANG-S]KID07756.1 GntR family transcriptional regulator [Leisingera sp. ANG1]